MIRWGSLVLAAVAGLVTGALLTVSLQAPALDAPGPAVSPTTSPTPAVPAGEPTERRPPTDPGDRVLLVWAAGGLPPDLADVARRTPGVTHVTSVAAGTVDLVRSRTADDRPVDELDRGWAVPLDTFAVDADGYGRFLSGVDRTTVAALDAGAALLGSTSAELRRLGPGGRLTLAGGLTVTVGGVADDAVIGAAELVVPRTRAAELGLDDRFLLLAHTGERAAVEDALRGATDVRLRIRGPGETPYLRHGDAVLPQAVVKATFGEFAYRRSGSGREVEQDPAWRRENVVTTDVPILGPVTCHRSVVKQLAGALGELERRGLGHLVDPDGYAGCHHPRLIAPGGALSRHAWGIALDLNADDNPTGSRDRQDPRLVETFTRWGFTWGGFWLQPDPMHVEWVGPPTPEAAKAVTPPATTDR